MERDEMNGPFLSFPFFFMDVVFIVYPFSLLHCVYCVHCVQSVKFTNRNTYIFLTCYVCVCVCVLVMKVAGRAMQHGAGATASGTGGAGGAGGGAGGAAGSGRRAVALTGGSSLVSLGGAVRRCVGTLVEKEGIRVGLFRGWWPTLLRQVPSGAVYFSVFEALKRQFGDGTLATAVAGGCGGCAGYLCTYVNGFLCRGYL